MFANSIRIFSPAAVCLVFITALDGQVLQSAADRLPVGSSKQGPPDAVSVVDSLNIPRLSPTAPSLSKSDKKLIEPSDTDKAKLRDNFGKSDYRIAKLLNLECAKGADSRYIVRADSACNNTIPGYGTHFSFRTGIHSIERLADIKIRDGLFIASSDFTQGVLVSLGSLDLKMVDLEREGVKFLARFVPAAETSEAQKQTEQINRGFRNGGYVYSGSAEIKENQTYVLRSIAYRFNNDATGDKRRDIIVAFTVLRQDDGGNVTFIWKELQDKPSPKLTIAR
jgi:hypothetical protein